MVAKTLISKATSCDFLKKNKSTVNYSRLNFNYTPI